MEKKYPSLIVMERIALFHLLMEFSISMMNPNLIHSS